MSLYGDLPQAKNSSGSAAGWATSSLKPILRKPSGFTAPPSVLRAGRGGGRTPIPGGRGGGRTPLVVDSTLEGGAGPIPSPAAATTTSSLFNNNIQDEYDPIRPNDYEAIVAEREKKKKEAEAEAERQAMLREMESEPYEEANEPDPPSSNPSVDREALLHMSGEEAFLRRARMAAGGRMGPPPSGPAGDNNADGPGAKGMTLAQKMLEKMGWKEGEGLGKHRQGMSTPLVAQKIGKRSGVIENAEQLNRPKMDMMPPPPDKKPRGVSIQGQPSRVVCLRNMVGPGEVDEELEDEVATELLKYGQVQGVLIFEVTTPGFDPEEAVRIFVKFDRTESATKALVDLQGRFFSGRTIRVGFFSEERFDNDDLAPQPGEF